MNWSYPTVFPASMAAITVSKPAILFLSCNPEHIPHSCCERHLLLGRADILLVGEKGERHVPLARLALTCSFQGTLQVQLHLIDSGVEILQAALKSILLLLPPAILSPIRLLSLSLQGSSALLHGHPPLVPQHWQEVPGLGKECPACILRPWRRPAPTGWTTCSFLWRLLLIHRTSFP